MNGFLSVIRLPKQDDEDHDMRREPEPQDNDTGDDRGPNESNAAYQLRKAMEATAGGDTRPDPSRK